MTNNNKKNIDFFGGDIVSNFDEVQKGLMPGHDLIFQTMEDVISFHFKRQESVDGWILDVGAGTGNDSMRVLQITEKKVDKTDEIIAKFKDMRILAIDSSTDMKNEFVNKFTQLFPEKTDGFEYLNKDITAITNDFIREKKYSNKCKIALSGYTLHHFHTDEKREIYQMMYDFLEPGGLLLNIDLFTFESNKIRQDAHNFDINYIKDNINDKTVKDKWIKHYQNEAESESHNALDPVEVQIDILKEIGFVDVECVFRYWQQGVIRATKPTEAEKPERHSLIYLENSLKIKNVIVKNETNLNTTIQSLDKDFKEKIKEELGVIAVGVSILSKADEDVRFLIESEVTDIKALGIKINNKHNFSISHKGIGVYDDFINFLYYIGRGSSIKYPEYLNRIKEVDKNTFENNIQKNIREKYETLHISAGEIMLFTLVWRYIIGKILTEETIKELTKYINNQTGTYKNPFNKDNNEYYLIEKIKEIKNQEKKNTHEKSILEAWGLFLSTLSNTHNIDKEFGIEVGNLNKNKNREALVEYAKVLFNNSSLSYMDEDLDRFIRSILKDFAEKLGFKDNPTANPTAFLGRMHEHARVPIMPFYFLMLGDEKKELKEQIVFPLLHTFSKENTMYPYRDSEGNEHQESAVIHAIWVVKPIKEINNTEEQPWYSGKFSFTNYIKVLHDLSQSVCLPIIDEYFEKEHKKNIDAINVHATRAAVSQVMARNMSHNIGSHVLSKMVGIKEAKDKFPLKGQYISSFDYVYDKLIPSRLDNNPIEESDKKDFNLANFNSYLRTRMDYLADIATGEPSMETTCMLVKDVMGEMDKNRILLDSISGVEKFPYTIKVKDCRECEDPNCDENTCLCTEDNNNDIPVSIPNGIMGYHALYIIIENLIRNSAKHQNNKDLNENQKINTASNSSQLSPREFILEIRNSQHDDTLYEVLIYDDFKISGKKQLNEDELAFYKEKTNKSEYDNSINTRLDWLVFEQNVRINKSVINEKTNRLREGAWGMIEMDASAAYLRKLAAEKIDENIYSIDLTNPTSRYNPDKTALNIIKAVNRNGYLGYRFHLLKPKELLVVDEKGETYKSLKEKSVLNVLRENGIWVLQAQNKNEKDFFNIEKVYAHPIMLVLAAEDFDVNNYLYVKGEEEDDKLLRGNLPFRIIVSKDTNDKDELSPWIAYIEKEHELINYLNRADKLIRKKIECMSDLEENTLMDLIWQVWLKNKMKFHKINGLGEGNSVFQLLIPKNEEGENTKEGRNIKVLLAHHGTTKDCQKNDITDFLLFYPSSVKSFIDKATKTKSQGVVKKDFDKYKTALLADSVFNKILIIDERVQASWEQNYSSINIKKQNIFRLCGLYSPDDKNGLNLNSPIFNNKHKVNIENLISYIDIQPKVKGLDFIIIHLGVIEKVLTANGENKNEEDVKKFILNLQNSIATKTRVIITSGRGKPDNLPRNVPFISFSALSQYAIETPFKPFLNQIIHNARIFKKS